MIDYTKKDGTPATVLAKPGYRPKVYPGRQPTPGWWRYWVKPKCLSMKWWEVGR